MTRTMFPLLLLLALSLAGVRSQGDLTSANCQIETKGFVQQAKTLILTVKENPKNQNKIGLKLVGLRLAWNILEQSKAYVKMTAALESTNCVLAGDGVVLSYRIVDEDALIELSPGDSILVFNGGKTFKVKHQNKNFVPINMRVREIGGNTVALALANNKNPSVLLQRFDNWLVVPKKHIDTSSEDLSVSLAVFARSHVSVTYPSTANPTLAVSKTSTIACLAPRCLFDVEKKEKANVLFDLAVFDDPNDDKPKFLLGAKSKEKIDLEKDRREVIRLTDDEISDNKVTFSVASELTNVEHPPRISIFSSSAPDRVPIAGKRVVYRGKPVSGVYDMEEGDVQGTSVSLKLIKPTKSYIQFNINNPEAQKLSDQVKSAKLTDKTVRKLIFFKDQVGKDSQTAFAIKNKADARLELLFEREVLNIKTLAVGVPDTIEGPIKFVVRRPPNKKDLTLIFELLPESPLDHTIVTIGGVDLKVSAKPFYHIILHEEFKGATELMGELKEAGAKVKYNRIDAIAPFPIVSGSQTLARGGAFKLDVAEPKKGLTLKLKPLKDVETNTAYKVGIEIELERRSDDQKKGKKMKVVREVESGSEGIIFIYPEDIKAASKLTGSLSLPPKRSVNVENNAGIEVITIRTGDYVVRRNEVKVEVKKTNEDNTIDIHLREDSLASSVTFSIDNKQFKVDKSQRQQSVLLTKQLLSQQPSPSASFATSSDNLDAHVDIRIRATSDKSDKVCWPACTGNRRCNERGECVCMIGYSGENCEKNASTSFKQSLLLVAVILFVGHLL